MTMVINDARVCIVGNPGGDWEGLYLNGKLMGEGHSISINNVLDNLLNMKLVSHEYRTCRDDWLIDLGNFPDNLNDVEYQHTATGVEWTLTIPQDD